MQIQTLKSPMRSVLLLASWIISASAHSQQPAVTSAPGAFFDLTNFTLHLPVANGDSIQEIKASQLTSYSSSYFYLNPQTKAMVFYCPSSGATTRNSHYPRSELRDNNEWTFAGQHSLTATLSIEQAPASGNIIVGQIHGNHTNTEALKIRWIKGDLVAGVKLTTSSKEERHTIATGVPLHTRFFYTIFQSERNVTVTVNGNSVNFTYDPSWDGEQVYFKAGNYLQDNATPESFGEVDFYSLQLNK